MPDGLAFVSMILGFAFVTVVGAKLGAGSHTALVGLFPTQGARDWPSGVQEADAPRFVIAPPSDRTTPAGPAADIPEAGPRSSDIVELYAGPIRPARP
jgi:hypothetical protein